ncbi:MULTISPECIES: Lar family restriction alleviation protein [Pantoea]|nr:MULTISPECIES: Lar family restriction alleviation protein [Pantoea]
MKGSTYSVTFVADYPDGDRYPLKIEVEAEGVDQATSQAVSIAESSRFLKKDLVLMSVIPELCPPALDGMNPDRLLKPCPFCGNDCISLVETLREFDGEKMFFVNCGCCNATQHPDSKEGAILNWNERTEPETGSNAQ